MEEGSAQAVVVILRTLLPFLGERCKCSAFKTQMPVVKVMHPDRIIEMNGGSAFLDKKLDPCPFPLLGHPCNGSHQRAGCSRAAF